MPIGHVHHHVASADEMHRGGRGLDGARGLSMTFRLGEERRPRELPARGRFVGENSVSPEGALADAERELSQSPGIVADGVSAPGDWRR
jgi:hypothetical protein